MLPINASSTLSPRAFEALGGQAWKQRDGAAKSATGAFDRDLREELDQLVLSNKFGALGLDDKKIGEHGDDTSDEGSGPESQTASAPQRRRQASQGKERRENGARSRKSSSSSHRFRKRQSWTMFLWRAIALSKTRMVSSRIILWLSMRSLGSGLTSEPTYKGFGARSHTMA
jgi:hypothetical protein